MIVGQGNYLYARGKKKSTVYHVRPVHNIVRNRGEIYVGAIIFPAHCIGRRVRVKVEFLGESSIEVPPKELVKE